MAKNQLTSLITADGTYALGKARKKRELETWFGLFYAYGTFSSGTIAWKWSPDNGETLLDMNDLSGSAITSTANDSFTSNIATGSNNSDPIAFYAVLSGAGSPSITIGYYDNSY